MNNPGPIVGVSFDELELYYLWFVMAVLVWVVFVFIRIIGRRIHGKNY